MNSASNHPNGGSYPPSQRSSTYVTDSKADLVSMEMSEARGVGGAGPTFTNSAWGKRTRLEKMLFVVIGLLVVALATVLAISIGQSVSQLTWNAKQPLSTEICTS